MKILLTIFAIVFAFSASAQTLKASPFHRLPPPTLKATFGATSAVKTTAWRFTAAAAGYDVVNNKVLTGIGYGYNVMHPVTDTLGNSSWYTDFTVNLSVYAAGNVAPSYSYGNTNIVAFGPSVGFFNKLINVGYLFYPPSNGSPAKSGALFNISIPLN